MDADLVGPSPGAKAVRAAVQGLQEELKAAQAQFHTLHVVLKLLKEQNHKLVKHGQAWPCCPSAPATCMLLHVMMG